MIHATGHIERKHAILEGLTREELRWQAAHDAARRERPPARRDPPMHGSARAHLIDMMEREQLKGIARTIADGTKDAQMQLEYARAAKDKGACAKPPRRSETTAERGRGMKEDRGHHGGRAQAARPRLRGDVGALRRMVRPHLARARGDESEMKKHRRAQALRRFVPKLFPNGGCEQYLS